MSTSEHVLTDVVAFQIWGKAFSKLCIAFNAASDLRQGYAYSPRTLRRPLNSSFKPIADTLEKSRDGKFYKTAAINR